MVKFQLYLANVFNSNVVVEMPAEPSHLIWLKHPRPSPSLDAGGSGSACCRPQATLKSQSNEEPSSGQRRAAQAYPSGTCCPRPSGTRWAPLRQRPRVSI